MMVMTLRELEEEVKRLKEQVAEGARAKDYLEIWKLQSRYVHLYHRARTLEIPDLFAQKTPGVSVEIEESGVYEGIEGVKKVFAGIFGEAGKSRGRIALHMTMNPIVEINKEGTRARGVWQSFGLAGGIRDGQKHQSWHLGWYDMEYVKEEGKWKFLKMAYRLEFNTSYEKGWVEEPQAMSIRHYPDLPPDKPPTYHMPYNPLRIRDIFEPQLPEPYRK
jgi:hypothetical protein